MSPFSWQGQNLCGLSLVFVKDWRVVHSISKNTTSLPRSPRDSQGDRRTSGSLNWATDSESTLRKINGTQRSFSISHPALKLLYQQSFAAQISLLTFYSLATIRVIVLTKLVFFIYLSQVVVESQAGRLLEGSLYMTSYFYRKCLEECILGPNLISVQKRLRNSLWGVGRGYSV